MNRYLLLALTLLLLAGKNVWPQETTSEFFTEDNKKIITGVISDYCQQLDASKVHTIYLFPKISGNTDPEDPFGPRPSRVEGDKIAIFLKEGIVKLIEGIRNPHKITAIDFSCEYNILPLMTLSPTTPERMIACGFLSEDRFFIRIPIPELGKADLIYDAQFSKWLHEQTVCLKSDQ